jgi:hypothetical protein
VPAGRTTEEAANPPASGEAMAKFGLTPKQVFTTGEGSRFYGTTRKGKYMTEQDAKQAGYKPAPKRP